MEYLLQLAASPAAWVALATLIVMEIVLGIDNLIFISILTNKLPEQYRTKARRIGIGMALILRLGLLGTIAYIVQLTTPVFEVLGKAFSWKDMILIPSMDREADLRFTAGDTDYSVSRKLRKARSSSLSMFSALSRSQCAQQRPVWRGHALCV